MEAGMDWNRGSELADRGVGATAEARLADLLPLIEYYAREMGELPGRLMMAASFLADLKLMPGWSAQPPEVREAIEKAEALAVSVMIRLMNERAEYGCADAPGPDMAQRLDGTEW
jgi:hypothetical protein